MSEQETEKMNIKAQTQAINTIHEALEKLEPQDRIPVIGWVASQLGEGISIQNKSPVRENETTDAHQFNDDDVNDDDALSDFFERVNPEYEWEKVLTIGYFIQKTRGQKDFDSQTVNDHLKNLGHPASNISVYIKNLRKKRFLLQTGQSKSGKQIRKKHKLTSSGIKKIKKMISKNQEEMENE